MTDKPKKSKARRGRGEGSVYQRESDGLWCCTITVGFTPAGKRRRRTIYGKTKTEALAKLKAEQRAIDSGVVRTTTRGTVGELLTRWLAFVKSRVEPKTFERYRSCVDVHLIPLLGGIPLERLTAENIDEAMTAIADKGRTCSNPFAALRRALNQARKWKLIAANPCQDSTPPAHNPREFVPLTRSQMLDLLRLSSQHRLHGLFVVLLTTGCRIGEAIALRWEDIDFDGARMRIVHTLEELNGKARLKVPKTMASRRVVLLPPITVEALEEHRERMRGEGFIDTPFVFVDSRGGFLRSSNVLRRDWRPLVKAVGAPTARIHDARHTVASLLVANGAPMRAIQGMLGHSSPSITMKHYAKFSAELQEATVDRVQNLTIGYKTTTEPAKPTVDSTAKEVQCDGR